MNRENERGRVDLTVSYPGAFLPALGNHAFEVLLDGACIVPRRGYRREFLVEAVSTPGEHELEVRCLNSLRRGHRSLLFPVSFPEPGSYEVKLDYDRLWGFWKPPEVARRR